MASTNDQDIAFPEIQNNAHVHHPVFGLGKVIMRTGTDERSKAIASSASTATVSAMSPSSLVSNSATRRSSATPAS